MEEAKLNHLSIWYTPNFNLVSSCVCQTVTRYAYAVTLLVLHFITLYLNKDHKQSVAEDKLIKQPHRAPLQRLTSCLSQSDTLSGYQSLN